MKLIMENWKRFLSEQKLRVFEIKNSNIGCEDFINEAYNGKLEKF